MTISHETSQVEYLQWSIYFFLMHIFSQFIVCNECYIQHISNFLNFKLIPVLFMELFPAELLKSKFRNILLIATVNMPTIISFIPGKTHISGKEKKYELV